MVIKEQMWLVLSFISGKVWRVWHWGRERERVTKGDKGRGEIRKEIAKFTGMAQMSLSRTGWEKGMEHLMDSNCKSGTIFTVCSHTFSLFWSRKISVIVKTYQLSFYMFMCAFHLEISSCFHSC